MVRYWTLQRASLCRRLTHGRAPLTDIRERDGGIADITFRERVEEVVGIILKLLSF
jgi:hypothetical protein